MRYLADILTLSRLLLAIVLLFITGLNGSPEAAFIVFIVAELTDIFDGTCAYKWPFPKEKTPKYRKYAAKFDMFSDGLLAAAQVLYLAIRINPIIGSLIIVYYLVTSGIGDLIIYGKILGHPDNCTKSSLIYKNFSLAKKIILIRRHLYTICLGIISILILFATSWPDLVKYGFIILGCVIFVFAWIYLNQRRHNISRDALEIEKKLTKKSQRQSRK